MQLMFIYLIFEYILNTGALTIFWDFKKWIKHISNINRPYKIHIISEWNFSI